MVEVSVLLIAYNHSKYIKKCLDSIIAQHTNFKFEILIHDDASTDGTQDIIREYSSKYSNIKTVLQSENQFRKGKTHPDEPLIPLATGKYICIVEGDDYWCDEQKLQKQYDVMEIHQDCSMSVHQTKCIDENENELNLEHRWKNHISGVIQSKDIFHEYFIKNKWPFQTSSFFVRKDIFVNRPPFWDKFYVGDLPMILWFAYLGNYYYIDDTMSCYRMFSSGSATSLNRQREYALRKAKTNAEGLIAFNEYTHGECWQYIKKITSLYIYQYFSGSKEILDKEYFLIAQKELSLKEKFIASLKFTKIGYCLRNVRENLLKLQLKKG